MPAPTTVTESDLKTYLHSVLDARVSAFLSWTVVGGYYDSIVEDALLLYGAEDISEITSTDMVQLMRACGRYCMWRKVVSSTTGSHDSDNYEIAAKWSQINTQARKCMEDEKALVDELQAALDTEGTPGFRVYKIKRTNDPLTRSHRHYSCAD
jgi:hypothetical protein